MRGKYGAILFATDGSWVIDHQYCGSVGEVWEKLENQGSRWFFYPLHAVITTNRSYVTTRQRIVDACDALSHCRGGSIRYTRFWIAQHPDLVAAMLGYEAVGERSSDA